ncbi:MAG: zinc ribbon domain-containing protein [Candidatus Helarchaeota archaeon]|nr:zinc ribbon domain-containing protein [Candidatus Helarchaeota archaeon]
MPVERINPKIFKEIKVYTLKRLLKKKNKYLGTPNEAEEYRKLEGIFLSKNINPFKLLDRGIATAADVQGAINELEEQGLIEIKNNLLSLTSGGIKIAEEIKDISSLAAIDDSLFETQSTEKDIYIEPIKSAESETISEPIKPMKVIITKPTVQYKCPDCGSEIKEPKNFCPKCGKKIDLLIEIKCPICGEINTPDSAFCIKCGKKLKE